ncbi:OB-fold nucleic acid binding domain-containing protein, partial [Isoptericola sp. NPDC060185]|uniref:helix-hairpin-helix domain-containing protein n=1 Tax=Isoptericola sp. NPDC060185 TaxID=3347065 RepID=UPI00365B35EA
AEPTLENAGTEIRLGLSGVRHIGTDLAERIVAARAEHGPFASMLDLTGRVELTVAQSESLATAGALDVLVDTEPRAAGAATHEPFTGDSRSWAATPAARALDADHRVLEQGYGPPDSAVPKDSRGSSVRRAALWAAGAAAVERPDRLPGTGPATVAPALPGMSALELAAADVWATGISPGSYPTEFLRAHLNSLGVVPACDLLLVEDGSRILVAGAVTHRQRPATAAGVTFLNLEDETGMVNVVCSVGLWTRYRRLAQNATALLIRGRIQNAEGAASVVADHLEHLDLTIVARSRDFR